MTKIEQLKSNPQVYYIYQVDYSIFNIPDQSPKYLVIVDKECTEKSSIEDGVYIDIITTEDWFKKVINSEIISWICSCLDKKFIIKEHVKLLGMKNDLKIRQNMERMISENLPIITNLVNDGQDDEARYLAYTILLYLNLSHQILDFNKIVNFKETKLIWNYLSISKGKDILNTYTFMLKPSLTRLKNRTANLIKKK